MIDDKEIAWNVSVALSVGREHVLTLQTTDGGENELLGFLLRLGGGSQSLDTTLAFVDILNNQTTQYATVCTDMDVGGLCHIHNQPKTEPVGGTLRLDQAAVDGLPLDVTVVSKNCGPQSPLTQDEKDVVNFCTPAESIYFHSVFNITFVDSGSIASPAMLFVGTISLMLSCGLLFL